MSADNFNPWEQIVFGIYLSNYTQPFVDSYEQAFQVGAGYGSNGAGAQSLQFSSGEEATNQEIIKGMLNIIINMEKNVALQPLYVTYSDLTGGKLTLSQVITQGQKTDSSGTPEQTEEGGDTVPDSGFVVGADVKRATLQDLFFAGTSKDNGAYLNIAKALEEGEGKVSIFDYLDGYSTIKVNPIDKYMAYASEGSIPTIMTMNSQNTGYKAIILDYTDQYDLQQFATAAVKAALAGDSYDSTLFDQMGDGFKDLKGDSLKAELDKYVLGLDCFGNIVVEANGRRYIVYPAAVNQHMTKEPEINLVNQLVMNGTVQQSDSNSYVLYGGFHKNEAWFADNYTGMSAFNNSNSGAPSGQIAIYYDTDSVAGSVNTQYQMHTDWKASIMAGRVIAWPEKTADLHWGQALKETFEAGLDNQATGMQFKMQVVNPDEVSGIKGNCAGSNLLYKNQIVAQSVLSNILANNGQKVNTKLQMLYNSKEQQDIFGDKVAVQVMTAPAKGNATAVTVARQFVNFVYQTYTNQRDSEAGRYIEKVLNEKQTKSDVRSALIKTDEGNPQPVLLEFWKAKGGQSGYWTPVQTSASKATFPEWNITLNMVDKLLPTKWKVNGQPVQSKLNIKDDSGDADITFFFSTDDEMFQRTAVVYTAQNVLQAVQDVLNCKQGADFETYATDVYYTYLKFYGILNDYGVQNEDSRLNPNIFSEDLVSDLQKINELLGDGNYMTSEQKLSQILDGTYTLLQRQLDRDYNITDFIYNQYYKMVYGRSQQTTVSSEIQTRNANGFLQIHTYSENFLTAFFMNSYAKYAAAVMVFLIVALIIFQLLKGKKFQWVIGNIFLMVNLIMLMPQVGEITPYVCNLIIENSFQNSMQFWQISETLNNYNVDQGLSEFSELSDEELVAATNIYKSHSALNFDHTLMLKLDISKKIMSVDQTDYTALQQLQTTRWLLPMILQQWQAQDGSYDYVQVTLGSEVDNIQNLYWMYKPDDAANSDTQAANRVNSQQYQTSWDSSQIDIQKVQALTNKFAGYNEQTDFDRTIQNSTVLTRSILYTKHPNIKDRPSNYFYILDETYPLGVSRTIVDGKGKTDWDTWYEQTLSSTTGNFDGAYDSIVKTAGQYDSSDPNTVQQSYGYLWTTQNPLHYFYFVVKEQMNMDYNLNDVYNVLQGDFVLNEKTGKEDLRKSDLMYLAMWKDKTTGQIQVDTTLTPYGVAIDDSYETADSGVGTKAPDQGTQVGYTYQASRDVLDLNHLFTNVVPYLYEMTLATGGTGDGTEGFFDEEDIIGSEYQVYEGNLKQWLFRSNWAIKIVENSSYNKPQNIKDANGNKYRITQTWDPKAYPAERPMVFSRAQQILQGLDDSDLQTFELKCIELNETICDEWTKLINYVNLEDMQPEVMYREMAVVALLEFNKAFQPQTFMGSNFVMYPHTMDIRYISFDSIMRMLMLNVSKNTQYIYNDTMQTVINSSDIFTAVILLIAAMLCSGVVPFLRDILMAIIFYLGFLAMIKQIIYPQKTKLHISGGIIMCNLVVMGMTAIYYATFQAMMGVTTYDAVLDLGQAAITTGTPLWCFLFVAIVSGLYIYAMGKVAVFVWQNKQDMGFEAFAEMTRSVTEHVNSFAEKVSGFFSREDSGSGTSRAKDISGSGNGTQPDVNNSNNVEKVQIVQDDQKRKQSDKNEDMIEDQNSANYQFDSASDNDYKDFDDSAQIDSEIEKGREIE